MKAICPSLISSKKQLLACRKTNKMIILLYSLLTFILFFSQQANAGEVPVIIGTQTSGPNKGFSVARFDTSTGKLSAAKLLEEAIAPAFFVIHPDKRHLYTCNSVNNFQGQSSGSISAYSLDPATAKLSLLNQIPSGGAGPCYISLDNSGHYAFVANYSAGNVSVFAINSDGSIGPRTAFVQHTGKSIYPERQTSAHAHFIKADASNRYVFVADLGTDKVFIYKFDQKTGTLSASSPAFMQLTPGAGPRHIAFHPGGRFIYVINELSCTITAFAWDSKKGTANELQTIATLPSDFKGENTCAEIKIHPNGKFLYGSNRGHNSIAAFAIENMTGKLTFIEHVPTQGQKPRNFSFDPSLHWMIVTNIDSDNAVVFRINEITGRLTQTGEPVSVPNPYCIQFVQK
jgi:6-phosphogluconolactonase